MPPKARETRQVPCSSCRKQKLKCNTEQVPGTDLYVCTKCADQEKVCSGPVPTERKQMRGLVRQTNPGRRSIKRESVGVSQPYGAQPTFHPGIMSKPGDLFTKQAQLGTANHNPTDTRMLSASLHRHGSPEPALMMDAYAGQAPATSSPFTGGQIPSGGFVQRFSANASLDYTGSPSYQIPYGSSTEPFNEQAFANPGQQTMHLQMGFQASASAPGPSQDYRATGTRAIDATYDQGWPLNLNLPGFP